MARNHIDDIAHKWCVHYISQNAHNIRKVLSAPKKSATLKYWTSERNLLSRETISVVTRIYHHFTTKSNVWKCFFLFIQSINTFCMPPSCDIVPFQVVDDCVSLGWFGLYCWRLRLSYWFFKSSSFFCNSSIFASRFSIVTHWLKH